MGRKRAFQKTGSAFDAIIDLQLNVSVDGATQRLSPTQALEQQTFSDAMAGSIPAAKTVLGWIAERDQARGIKTKSFPQFFVADPEPIDIDAAMLALGIASEDSSRTREGGGVYLQLEPWVAEHCEKRTRNSSVKDDELLRSSTRQVDDDWGD